MTAVGAVADPDSNMIQICATRDDADIVAEQKQRRARLGKAMPKPRTTRSRTPSVALQREVRPEAEQRIVAR